MGGILGRLAIKSQQDIKDYQKLKIQIDTLNICHIEKDELKREAIYDLSGIKSRVRELKLKELFRK